VVEAEEPAPLGAAEALGAAPPVRVVTAASLFDGHDAAINIMRRILQAQGAEVIHLGHDRSVEEIAEAAVEEDAEAVAVSSYQGGHMEFFRYLVQRLRGRGAGPYILPFLCMWFVISRRISLDEQSRANFDDNQFCLLQKGYGIGGLVFIFLLHGYHASCVFASCDFSCVFMGAP